MALISDEPVTSLRPAPPPAPLPSAAASADEAARELGIRDSLVFERGEDLFRLVGGHGRGTGWAGIVELGLDDEPHLARAWRTGLPVRVHGAVPVRVAGPYWAVEAVVVPVGHDHVVVVGSDAAIAASDARLVRLAARIVAEDGGIPAEKLLADELELVHAIRRVMAYRPETVRDTIRHVARVAAEALSCEYVALQVEQEGLAILEVLDRGSGDPAAPGPDASTFLADAAGVTRPIVEQGAAETPRVFRAPVVSRMTMPVGRDRRLGAMALAHGAEAPRGFTLLCQRIGLAIAEAAELLITQAYAREQLAAERDLLHALSRTDPLTGLANRIRWEEALAEAAISCAGGCPAVVLSCDLDGLKRINDRHGHPTGDRVILAAATMIRSCVRDGDLVARIGGDEFVVLCRDADAEVARAIKRRLAHARAAWRSTERELTPDLSIGWAEVEDGDVAGAVQVADARMYAEKRRRARRRLLLEPAGSIDRRVA